MVLSSSKCRFFLILITLSVIGLLLVGQGQEGGNAVGTDVQGFLLHKIGGRYLTVIDYRIVPVEEVPLSIGQEIKHIAKNVLILAGISVDREYFAIEFDLQPMQSKEHIYCLFRVHGDRVIRIIIKAASKADGSAIRLQKLIEKSFPDYDVPIYHLEDGVRCSQ